MTTIRHKQGKCKDCPQNTPEQPLIAGRCNTHYWQYRASLKAPKESKPRPSIKKVSSKREKVNAVYKVLRKQFLKDHPVCGADLPGCKKAASEIHHRSGRDGSNMLDTTTYLQICTLCHQRITTDSAMAIEKGLSNRRNTAIK